MAPQPGLRHNGADTPLHISPNVAALRIEVHRLLGFILRRPVGDEENPSRATEPGWDSLKHIELVFLFEDHFGMRFSEQEIAELEDARGIERVIEKRFLEERPLPSRGVEACGTA
jgi:acyl carrier protein